MILLYINEILIVSLTSNDNQHEHIKVNTCENPNLKNLTMNEMKVEGYIYIYRAISTDFRNNRILQCN